MEFIFYAVMHNMRLENTKIKGKKIILDERNARITNSLDPIKDILNNSKVNSVLGIASYNEFSNGATYIYLKESFRNMTSEETRQNANGYTFYLLRKLEHFIHYMWAIKDHNIYVRDGFLTLLDNHAGEHITYKAALTSINSLSSGKCEEYTLFTDKELEETNILLKSDLFSYNDSKFTELKESEYYRHYKYGDSDFFYKSRGSNRLIRAAFFSVSARASAHLQVKIMYYINALECLFTTDNSEVSHKVAERICFLLGDSKEERIELYKKIKKAYGIRSKVVHGSVFSDKDIDLELISTNLDDIVRKLLVEHSDFFNVNDDELNKNFNELIFDN